MNTIRALSIAAGLVLAGISIVQADTTVAGSWKLAVGSSAPCTLTLTADASPTAGTAAQGSDCAGGLGVIGHWQTAGTGLQLLSPSGNLVAWLKPKGDAYEGTRVEDGRKVALTR